MQLFETIDRILRIHKLIQREATGTPDEFAARLHLKRRQLYNILEEFKACGAVIKYSRLKSTFYYDNEFEVSIKILATPLSETEKKIIIGGNTEKAFCAMLLHNQSLCLSL